MVGKADQDLGIVGKADQERRQALVAMHAGAEPAWGQGGTSPPSLYAGDMPYKLDQRAKLISCKCEVN